jgi:hypothetical protein
MRIDHRPGGYVRSHVVAPREKVLSKLQQRMRAAQMPGAKPGTQIPGKLVVDEFIYSTGVLELLANGRATAIVTIEQDANFVIIQRVAAIFINGEDVGNVNDSAPVMVQMSDVSSGQVLNDWTKLQAYAGTAQQPFDVPQRKVLAAMQSVRFDFINNSDTDFKIQLSLIGKKVFL